MKRILLAFTGAVLLATGASAQTDPQATFYACQAGADAARQRALSACQPNPRDRLALQRCRTRAQDRYTRDLARCQGAFEQAVRRAEQRAREAERRAQRRNPQ